MLAPAARGVNTRAAWGDVLGVGTSQGKLNHHCQTSECLISATYSYPSPFGVGGFLAIVAMESARGVLVLYHESGELVPEEINLMVRTAR
jgi:hypothetical protein